MRGVSRARSASFSCGRLIDLDAQDAGRARDDLLDLLRRIEFQAVDHAEAVTQRRRQRAGPRGRADDRELAADPAAASGPTALCRA